MKPLVKVFSVHSHEPLSVSFLRAFKVGGDQKVRLPLWQTPTSPLCVNTLAWSASGLWWHWLNLKLPLIVAHIWPEQYVMSLCVEIHLIHLSRLSGSHSACILFALAKHQWVIKWAAHWFGLLWISLLEIFVFCLSRLAQSLITPLHLVSLSNLLRALNPADYSVNSTMVFVPHAIFLGSDIMKGKFNFSGCTLTVFA